MSPHDAQVATMEQPAAAFAAERARRVTALADDEAFRRVSLEWIKHSSRHQYTYNFTWLGRPVIQFPQDLIATQEIIWATRPTLIIETGIAHGGSIIFWASILELMGSPGHVLGIDCEIRPHNRQAIESHRLAPRITLIEGSSTDAGVVARVREHARDGVRVMILLDSDHGHDHVLRELEHYGPLVTPGCYLIVFDTLIDDLPPGFIADRPWGRGNNPKTAVRAYLKTTSRFEVDREIQGKLGISVAPEGYLRCLGP